MELLLSRHNSIALQKTISCGTVRSVLLTPEIFWPDNGILDEINHNQWAMNYWGRPQCIKIIVSQAHVVYDHALFYFLYLEYDWHPAKKPHDMQDTK